MCTLTNSPLLVLIYCYCICRPAPLLWVVHSSTQKYIFVGTLVAVLPQGMTLVKKTGNFVYPYSPPPYTFTIPLLYLLCAHTSLDRRRSPAAALVGCRPSRTQQYIFDGTLVSVPPQGVTRE